MAEKRVRIAIDTERCITGGQCEMLEPEVFLVDDDTAISTLLGNGELPADRAAIVIDRCPGRALSIITDPVDNMPADDPAAGDDRDPFVIG